MLDQETKTHINSARDILVGKVPDPKSQIEQITTALIYKFMDDMDRENEGVKRKATFLVGKLANFTWGKLMSKKLSGDKRWDLYTRALDSFTKASQIPDLFRTIFKSAYLPYRDPQTLNLFLKEINEFQYGDSEKLGDTYEYLLSILGSQGDAGQFRTPRNIIDFIVEVVAPQKNETVLDPACGTAGFLISTFKYIKKYNSSNFNKNTDPLPFAHSHSEDVNSLSIQSNGRYKSDKLIPDDHIKISENIIGYDIAPEMTRLSLVNLYLHGFKNPTIHEYDTLTSEDKWDKKFNVIFANPPFMTPKGGIRPHQKFSVRANRAEVLFVDYIAEHLNKKGRAGIIVPEGIIFQAARSYKSLRKNLIENWGLYAVVSLPSGIFNPYSGVKTSILFLDRELATKTDEILFLKVENDGFDLGAKRRAIDKNDLPFAFKALEQWKQNQTIEKNNTVAFAIPKKQIAKHGEYNLTGERYRKTMDYRNATWEMVELGEVCEVYQPKTITSKQIRKTGMYKVFGANGVIGYFEKYNHEEAEVAITCRGATCGTTNFTEPKSWITGNAMVIKPKDKKKLNKSYLFYLLRNSNLSSVISGAAQPQITRSGILSRQIPLPLLKIQEQIVTEIEQYQKVIDGAKQVLKNYKPTFRIDPQWPMVELGEVCEELFAGGDAPKNYSKVKTDEFNIPIYSNGKDEKSLYGFGNIARVFKPSITISARGTIGYSSIKTESYLPIVRLIVVIPNTKKINLQFLKYIIDTVDIYNNGNSIPQLTIPMIKNEKIPLPPLEIQKQIVTEIEVEQKAVDECKNLIVTMEQKIKNKISEVWQDTV